jgi:hypothetical protein
MPIWLLRSRLLLLVVFAALLLPSVTGAAALPEYTARLARDGASYRLRIVKDGKEAPADLPSPVKTAIAQKLRDLALSGVATPSAPDVVLDVTVGSELELDLALRPAVPRTQAFLSCVRSWYRSLPRQAFTGAPSQRGLQELLTKNIPSARQELEPFAASLSRHLQESLGACSRQFSAPPSAIGEELVLHSGVAAWLSQPVGGPLAALSGLLEIPLATFDGLRAGLVARTPHLEHLAEWVRALQKRASPPALGTSFAEVSDNADGAQPSRGALAMQAVRRWTSRDDVERLLLSGAASPELARALESIDEVVETCFEKKDRVTLYRCGAGEDLGARLVRLVLEIEGAGAVSFLVRI